MIKKVLSKFELGGGRKFLVSIALFFTATALLWFSKISSAEWVNMVNWVFAAFAAGNVGEHYVKGKNAQ